MTKQKLSIEDFYHQFHGHEHHNDPGDHVKAPWYETNPTRKALHKGLDLKAHARWKASKRRKTPVKVHKNPDTMRLELARKGK